MSYAAIVFGLGTYPIDFAQGFPGGRYMMLGFRFAPAAPPAPAGPRVLQVSRLEPTSAVVFALEITDTPNGDMRVVTIHAPAARSVEISGDFSQWQPLALVSKSDGSWSVAVPLRSGTYQTVVRIDGGAWQAPPGLLSLVDEFGGVVGLLVVR